MSMIKLKKKKHHLRFIYKLEIATIPHSHIIILHCVISNNTQIKFILRKFIFLYVEPKKT